MDVPSSDADLPITYSQRSLPYLEDLSKYNQYEVIGDMSDIRKAINNAPIEVRGHVNDMLKRYKIPDSELKVRAAYDSLTDLDKTLLDDKMLDRGLTLSNMSKTYIGEIDTVFGTGGGIQIQLGGPLQFYIDLGLVKEVI